MYLDSESVREKMKQEYPDMCAFTKEETGQFSSD